MNGSKGGDGRIGRGVEGNVREGVIAVCGVAHRPYRRSGL